jgi:hypothetical protein
MATGAGKTLWAAACIEEVLRFGPVLWLTHRVDLVEQSAGALRKYLTAEVGFEQAERTAYGEQVVVASVQTLSGARLAALVARFSPVLIVCDEAHHVLCASWHAIKTAFADARVLNLTATPFRTDFADPLDLGEVLVNMPLSECIKRGLLVPPIPCGTLKVSLDGVSVVDGDYGEHSLAKVIQQPEYIEAAAELFWSKMVGPKGKVVRRGIAFAATVSHGKALTTALRRRGLVIGEVYDSTTLAERQAIYAGVKAGTVHAIVNNLVLVEGLDLPCLDLVGMFRISKSAAMYTQAIGRGLRLCPETGKTDCLVVDAVDVRKHATGPATAFALPSPSDVLSASARAGRQMTASELFIRWFSRTDEVRSYLAHDRQVEWAPETVMTSGKDIIAALFGAAMTSPRASLRAAIELLDKAWHDGTGDGYKELLGVTMTPSLEAFARIMQSAGWVYCPRGDVPETQEELGSLNPEPPGFTLDVLVDLDGPLKNFFRTILTTPGAAMGGATDSNFAEQSKSFYKIVAVEGVELAWMKPIDLLDPLPFYFFRTKITDHPAFRAQYFILLPDSRIYCYRELRMHRKAIFTKFDLNELTSLSRQIGQILGMARVPVTTDQAREVAKRTGLSQAFIEHIGMSCLTASAYLDSSYNRAVLKQIYEDLGRRRLIPMEHNNAANSQAA